MRVATSSIDIVIVVTATRCPSYFCSAMFNGVDRFGVEVVVGSSSTRKFGFCSISRQKMILAASPPESVVVDFQPFRESGI